MTGFIVSVFPFRNRVSLLEAFEGLELGEGKPSRPVLRGPGGRKAAWLLGTYRHTDHNFRIADHSEVGQTTQFKRVISQGHSPVGALSEVSTPRTLILPVKCAVLRLGFDQQPS